MDRMIRTKIAPSLLAAVALCTTAFGAGPMSGGPLGTAPLSAQITDPLPDPVTRSQIAVVIEDYLYFPASAERGPQARINHIRFANDGTDRQFVNDLRGRLYVVEAGGVTTYLDVSAEMPAFVDAPGLGSGFGSFAFHPQFASNGLLYTVHTESVGSARPDLTGPSTVEPVIQGVVTEWHTDDPRGSTFSGTHREVLRIEFPGTIHGIQEITFNPLAAAGSPEYGLLYIGVGEGGSVVAELVDNSGTPTSALGTILRIDPRGDDSTNGAYGIPDDNPWANDDDADTVGEIWALGFRNPTRLSWDSGGNGTMLISEIGEDNIEEINVGVAGAHYGFPAREGTFRFDPTNPRSVYALASSGHEMFTPPVAQYDHDDGRAVVGGAVYRGDLMPDLYGHYVFGDITTGKIFHFDVAAVDDGGPVTIQEVSLTRLGGTAVTLRSLVGSNRVDLHFGVDPDGEMYVLTKADGAVRRLTGQSSQLTVRPELTGDFDEEWLSDGSGDWEVADGTLALTTAPVPEGPIRRPGAIALLRDRSFQDVVLEADVRSTADPSVIRADVLLIFGYQSPTNFYYVHLSGITDGVHNGIFIVDDADRRRIDDGTATPVLPDREWHHVRLDHDSATGRIDIFADGSQTPTMSAVDRSFAGGGVGFGSFDDTGLIRDIVVRGRLVIRSAR
jgi:glucose/arabinose dehydrogenase